MTDRTTTDHVEPVNAYLPSWLRLFVYGTLKQGYWNHKRYCRGAISVERAIIHGRLYELPSGVPVLDVPQESILAVGTDNIHMDCEMQDRFTSGLHTCGESVMPQCPLVKGEILTFPDPEHDLPPIDRLEGFRPGFPSLYRRVLVPIRTASGHVIPVWAFVLGVNADSCALNLNKGGNEWNPEIK